jgi:hypothetical protein
LIELKCGYREGLLLDIMQMLRELRIETIAVQSSSNNGIFVGELRAKVCLYFLPCKNTPSSSSVLLFC